MLLLEYKPLTDQDNKPFAPMEIWTEGIIEETVISWVWQDGSNGIFKKGWFGLLELNFDHPHMLAFIKRAHREQQECLDHKPIRYPLWR